MPEYNCTASHRSWSPDESIGRSVSKIGTSDTPNQVSVTDQLGIVLRIAEVSLLPTRLIPRHRIVRPVPALVHVLLKELWLGTAHNRFAFAAHS